MTTYEIRKGKNAPCELVSITPTGFVSKPVINFVAEGTHTKCADIKAKLEAMK